MSSTRLPQVGQRVEVHAGGGRWFWGTVQEVKNLGHIGAPWSHKIDVFVEAKDYPLSDYPISFNREPHDVRWDGVVGRDGFP